MNVSYDQRGSKLLGKILAVVIPSLVTLLVVILPVMNRCLEAEDFCVRLLEILTVVILSVLILPVVILSVLILPVVILSVLILPVVNHCLRPVVDHCLRLVLVAEDYHGLLMVQRQLRQERARTK
jgi:hypothetical protein